MISKKRSPLLREQRLVAEILTQFMFCRTMQEVFETWDCIYKLYDLCEDPFTGCPCSYKEYVEMCEEYDKQTMIERYDYYE